MSNRRKPRHSVLDAVTGRRLPGGCDDCDAFQVLTQQAAGVYELAIHHDDGCPYYRGVTR